MTSSGAVVYAAINLLNDKMYVGATEKGMPKRRATHLSNARRGKVSKFYTALRKYGPDKFKFLVIQNCDDFFDALAHERRLIGLLKPEYNMTEGGGGVKGLKFSAASRKKMSDAKIGKPGLWARQTMPDELRKKIGDMRRAERGNKVISAEVRGKLRVNVAKASASRRQPVQCVNDGLTFPSVTAAARHYGVNVPDITNWCNGMTSRKGLMFRRVERAA